MKTPEFEYVGCLHIHSSYSDGAGTIPEIAKSADKAGLDFVILNDHDYMTESLHLDEEGFYKNVLVLLGAEIGKRYHHYLAFNLKEMVSCQSAGPQEIIDRVNKQGGFGFLAHPFEKGMPLKEKSIAYTWNDLSVTDYAGVCIWNFTSRWKERVKTPIHGLFFLLFKSQLLKGPSQETLRFWDELCRKKRVAAIGGSDAHASVFKWGVLRFRPLSYEFLLNSINVHILLEKKLSEDFIKAKLEVYEALREGRSFIAHERLAPARGFRFCYVSENDSCLTMGEERPFQPGYFSIETPAHGEIRLLRNGALQKKWRGQQASYSVKEGGAYRVEVYYHRPFFGWRPWIFSNPIYLW